MQAESVNEQTTAAMAVCFILYPNNFSSNEIENSTDSRFALIVGDSSLATQTETEAGRRVRQLCS